MNPMPTFRIVCSLLLILWAGLCCGTLALAGDEPEMVMLESMAELFEGVAFDHNLHTELGEDCAVCHHHTTGTGTADPQCVRCHADSPATVEVACTACHAAQPFSAEQIQKESLDLYQYHVDRPGLKAAYHWNCVGCHDAMGGPTACQDCHPRTAAGEAFYHADAQPSAARADH